MFFIKKIDFSNFNTDNVTNMYVLFFCCHSLSEINLSKFNIENVIDMSDMFYKSS